MAAITGVVRDELNAPLNGALVRAHRRDTGVVLGEATSATVASGDTLSSSVALRLNFDGGVAVDTSQYAHAVTLVSGAVVEEGVGKFGGALNCMAVGNDAHAALAPSENLRVTGAFCLEFWLKLEGVALDWPDLIGGITGTVNGSITFGVHVDNNFRARVLGTTLVSPVDSRVFSQWTHFAITRTAAGVHNLFIDGVSVDGGYTDTASMPSAPTWKFGAFPEWFGDGGGGRAYLDDIVLTLGSNRYPGSGFTPPTAPSAPGTSTVGAYEIANTYVGECYVVAAAPTGGANPVRNHVVHRVNAI